MFIWQHKFVQQILSYQAHYLIRLKGLACCVLVLLFLAGCEIKTPAKPSGKVIKIGVLLPENDHQMSHEGLAGVELIRKMRPLLDNGDKIKLVVKSITENHASARKVVKQMLTHDQVAAVMIFSNSDLLLAISNLAEQFKTPFIALNATHPEVTSSGAFVSQFVFDDSFQGAVAAMFVRDELLVERVAVIYDPKSSSSKFLGTEFVKTFIQVNGKVPSVEAWPQNDRQLKEVLVKTLRFHPELLYLPIAAEQVIQVAKQLERQSTKPMLMGADGLISDVLLSDVQINSMEGLMATDFFAVGVTLTPFGKWVENQYTFSNDKVLLSYAPLGAEGLAFLMAAMNRCKNPTNRECINNQLRDEKGFKGIIGKIQIQADGKAKRPLVVSQIKEGEAHFLVKVY